MSGKISRKKKNSRMKCRKLPCTVKPSNKQTGTSNLKYDRKKKALPPGKRISKSGKTYYEYRRNRSDLTPEEIPPSVKRKLKRELKKVKRQKQKIKETLQGCTAKTNGIRIVILPDTRPGVPPFVAVIDKNGNEYTGTHQQMRDYVRYSDPKAVKSYNAVVNYCIKNHPAIYFAYKLDAPIEFYKYNGRPTISIHTGWGNAWLVLDCKTKKLEFYTPSDERAFEKFWNSLTENEKKNARRLLEKAKEMLYNEGCKKRRKT